MEWATLYHGLIVWCDAPCAKLVHVMPSDVASSSMHCSDVGSTALASHTRPSVAQTASQSVPPTVLATHCWLSSWLEHEGPRETGGAGGGEGEGGGGESVTAPQPQPS